MDLCVFPLSSTDNQTFLNAPERCTCTIRSTLQLRFCLLLRSLERVIYAEAKCVDRHRRTVHAQPSCIDHRRVQIRDLGGSDQTHVHLHFILKQLHMALMMSVARLMPPSMYTSRRSCQPRARRTGMTSARISIPERAVSSWRPP